MGPFLIGMAEWISAVFSTAVLLPLLFILKKDVNRNSETGKL